MKGLGTRLLPSCQPRQNPRRLPFSCMTTTALGLLLPSRPMDLSTIKKNVETGVTRTDTEFQRDMLLMFQNAFMYNSSDHAVHQMADEMRTDVMENIQDYLATQMQLMVETTGTKVLRSGGRREFHDESIFSPAKKRRTRADDAAS